jgi:hypothetical protein
MKAEKKSLTGYRERSDPEKGRVMSVRQSPVIANAEAQAGFFIGFIICCYVS